MVIFTIRSTIQFCVNPRVVIPYFIVTTFLKRKAVLTRSTLATALLATGLTCSLTAGAGIMHPDFEPLLYGDFAEGRGYFAPNKTGPIQIFDVNGNLRGTISQPLPLSAVADGHYATMINPSFSLSATHVNNAQNLLFGNQTSFIYNDSTLFKNSAPSKPFSGEYNDLQRVFYDIPKYQEIYLKYLGNSYHAAHFDAMRNTYQRETDLKVTRYTKLNTEAIPIALLSRSLAAGEDVVHVGAGNTRIIEGNNSRELTRGTPVGGFVRIEYTTQFNGTDVNINGSNYRNKPYYGLGYRTRFAVSTSKQMALPHATLTNDSGSGLFAWNDTKQRWEIAAVTSQGSTATGFGKETLFIGNPSWTDARVNYYNDPTINLSSGQAIVFHGQNDQNGNGYLHLVNSQVQDQLDDKLRADIARAKQDNELHATHQAYRITQERNNSSASAFKPGVAPNAETTPDNSSYTPVTGITRIAYHGLAWGYDFTPYGQSATADKYRFYHNQELQRRARNLTFLGAGSNQVYNISFASDIKEGKNVINLGAASLSFANGNFYLGDSQNYGLKSFIHAGYDIASNASLTLALNGQEDDAIHKIGAGKLIIAGSGKQLSPLNIGDGIVELQRSQGYAAPYIKIATGRATVKLNASNQLNRKLDNLENNVGFGFGRDGGTLDFAGFDPQQTWRDIYHLDAGARIINSNTQQNVAFTFQPDGTRTYKGEFAGNLNLTYDPSLITNEPKTWYLTGNTYITGDFRLKQGGTVRVGDYQEPRAWGTTFTDRYLNNTLVANNILVEEQSTLSVGRNAVVQGKIVLNQGATLDIHNLGDFVNSNNPNQVPMQPVLERTIVAGELQANDGSNIVVTTNQEHRVDLYSDTSGQGQLTLQGNGRVNVLGNNDKFTGIVVFNGQNTSFGLNRKILSQITPAEPQGFIQGYSSYRSLDSHTNFTRTDYVYTNVISTANADAQLPKLLGLNTQGQLTSAQYLRSQWNSSVLNNVAQSANRAALEQQVSQIKIAGLNNSELTPKTQQPNTPETNIANPTVITFFNSHNAWNNAHQVVTNEHVILHAHLNENSKWNFANYTGDGILVKSGTGNLYLANHNLNGLVYLASGKLSGNSFAKDVMVKSAGQLIVNANAHTGTSIYGNLDNAGLVLVTDKKEQLLATSDLGTESTQNTSVSNRNVNNKLHTIPAHTQLYIGGDYSGHNGIIEFATSEAPEQIYIQGKVLGTTQLKVGSFKASTAQKSSSFDLIEAKGSISAENFILPQGYVTGGIYDYRLEQQDNKIVLTSARNHVTETQPKPQPSQPVTPEPPRDSQPSPGNHYESDNQGSSANVAPAPNPTPAPPVVPNPVLKPDVKPDSKPVPPVQNNTNQAKPAPNEPVVNTPTTNKPTPNKPTPPATSKPQHLVLNPQDTKSARIVQQVEFDSKLVHGKQVLSKEQSARQIEYDKHNIELSDTANSVESVSNSSTANISSASETSGNSSQASNKARATSLVLDSSESSASASARFINSSLGSLMANAQFLQHATLVDFNRLNQAQGLTLTTSREQSSLDFSGVDYGSSYVNSGWTLGYNLQYQPNLRLGAWFTTLQGLNQVDNGVSTAQGQLASTGWGAFASWELNPLWQVEIGYQQLSYQAQTTGAHEQRLTGTTRNFATQVNYTGWQTQWGEFNLSARPYLNYSYSQLPFLKFVSNLGEELGNVNSQANNLQLGIQAQATYRNLSAQLGLSQQLINQAIIFQDAFAAQQIAVHPQNWQINSQLSYQFNRNWSLHANIQAQARYAHYNLSIAWKW